MKYYDYDPVMYQTLYYGHYIPFLTVAFHDKNDDPDLSEEENEKQRI